MKPGTESRDLIASSRGGLSRRSRANDRFRLLLFVAGQQATSTPWPAGWWIALSVVLSRVPFTDRGCRPQREQPKNATVFLAVLVLTFRSIQPVMPAKRISDQRGQKMAARPPIERFADGQLPPVNHRFGSARAAGSADATRGGRIPANQHANIGTQDDVRRNPCPVPVRPQTNPIQPLGVAGIRPGRLLMVD